MSRLLLDEHLSPALSEALRSHGHDAVSARAVGLGSTPDQVIMTWAARERRAVVTLDHDFQDHLWHLGASRPSVIHLSQRDGSALIGPAAQLDRLSTVLPELEPALAAGTVVTLGRSTMDQASLPLSTPVHRRSRDPVRDATPSSSATTSRAAGNETSSSSRTATRAAGNQTPTPSHRGRPGRAGQMSGRAEPGSKPGRAEPGAVPGGASPPARSRERRALRPDRDFGR